MKKNKMMRLASVLLVLTLLSTSVISGTFAKYTTSVTGTDKARVAYWGFDDIDGFINTTIDLDLFDGEYTGTDGTTVDSENDDNVLAPGTSKTVDIGFGYTAATDANALTAGAIGAPEVDYTFKIELVVADDADYDSLDANTNFYWTLKKSDETEATKYQTVAEFKAAVEAMAGEADGEKKYEAGNLPTYFTNADEKHTIGWVWEFEDEDDPLTTDIDEEAKQDVIDTAMGNALTNLDDITFTLTITATQVD